MTSASGNQDPTRRGEDLGARKGEAGRDADGWGPTMSMFAFGQSPSESRLYLTPLRGGGSGVQVTP